MLLCTRTKPLSRIWAYDLAGPGKCGCGCDGVHNIVNTSKGAREVSAIILAAGGSSRYGQCKQLVKIDGSSLVRHAVSKLSSLFSHDRISVVVGANSQAVAQAISDLPVNIVHNEYWQKGLASSLIAGINAIEPGGRAVMITLCDQVLVAENHLRQLLGLWIDDPSMIIASNYAETLGTPAVIPAEFYPQLLALEGDAGAKSILKNNAGRVTTAPVPEAEFDLDVPADLEKLNKQLYRSSATK